MADLIKSPYQDDLDRLQDDRSYFDFYDDLPASVAWMHTIGSALGNAFGVSVIPVADEWSIDHKTKEMKCGSIEQIYTRRGVLGLLLNGIGRLAKGIATPSTTKEAAAFAKVHKVKPETAKHFGALARIVDEVRTDDEMAKSYAGGERVVGTMHAQAYEGANEQLRLMAMDMKVRRELARDALEFTEELTRIVEDVGILGTKDSSSKAADALRKKVHTLFEEANKPRLKAALQASFWDTVWMNNEISGNKVLTKATGRVYAAMLIALHPEMADTIAKVLVRAYTRNVHILGNQVNYDNATVGDEKEVMKVAGKIHHDLEELKALASHQGGHAQYVLAKAEQYYHGSTLGIAMVTPFFGYDQEARLLDVEAANDSAREVAQAMVKRGLTKDQDESVDFAKELLPLVEKYPFLDLNDGKKNDGKGKGQGSGNGSMNQRVMGAGKETPPKKKREKEREKKSQGDRAKDRRKMEAMDNKKNQEKVDKERDGYSILGKSNIDPLSRYLYIIGPYLGRISATAAKIRRILKVNDPLGLRGAYRKGKALNTKKLYRHRLDDYKLFSKKEVDKDFNYGFALMGDLSGSTETRYTQANNRLIQDEILASAFIIAEVAERIGEKIMCSIGFFTDEAKSVKRPAFYLNRSKIVSQITNHGGGTNVNAAGTEILPELQEMEDFKIKNKTIVFITDGAFNPHEFLSTVQAAKKFNAAIAYFSLSDNVQYGVQMCKEVEKFTQANAKGVRIRTRNITLGAIHTLPEAIAQLMKETIGVRV